ncbi:MAG: hypothetical protein EOP37_10565 [Rubrivivax sp.]|nr:MAG: hypothetical protein EOP37_10565 [Rubrivivax sp.]
MTPQPLDEAEGKRRMRELAEAPPTRRQRIRSRLAEGVPWPLRRAWRAVDGAVHRLIDRLRPRMSSASAPPQA